MLFCLEEILVKFEENILKMRFILDVLSDCKVFDIVDVLFDGVGVGSYNEVVSYFFYLYYFSVFLNDYGVCWFVFCFYLLVIGGLMELIFG